MEIKRGAIIPAALLAMYTGFVIFNWAEERDPVCQAAVMRALAIRHAGLALLTEFKNDRDAGQFSRAKKLLPKIETLAAVHKHDLATIPLRCQLDLWLAADADRDAYPDIDLQH